MKEEVLNDPVYQQKKRSSRKQKTDATKKLLEGEE